VKSRLVVWLQAAALASFIFCVGCTGEESSLSAVEDGAFDVTVTLCRKVGSKSGRRIGAGDKFHIAKKSQVRAFADFGNVTPGRDYTVHLVWIRPDGREMFRRYAEVLPARIETGEYQAIVRWLDAEDLHKVRVDTLTGPEPAFTLESRFNISSEKNRQPGEYRFRVYLDRALLRDEPFKVLPQAG
jgi:hypothetical protein